jgi:NAD(P)-dependent dehydrogenase (short-subunit alcohol dehydrogenase family)
MEKRTNHRRSSLHEPNRNASIMSTATRLSKTVALVTGGGSGLGAAAANYLLKNGARVLVGDLDKSRWEATVLQLQLQQLQPKESADRCLFAHVDVTQPDSISKALDRIQQEFGEPLNAAINCTCAK